MKLRIVCALLLASTFACASYSYVAVRALDDVARLACSNNTRIVIEAAFAAERDGDLARAAALFAYLVEYESRLQRECNSISDLDLGWRTPIAFVRINTETARNEVNNESRHALASTPRLAFISEYNRTKASLCSITQRVDNSPQGPEK